MNFFKALLIWFLRLGALLVSFVSLLLYANFYMNFLLLYILSYSFETFIASLYSFSLGHIAFVYKTVVYESLSSAGSGSSYLYGFFDQAWKEGMTKDEAEVWLFGS